MQIQGAHKPCQRLAGYFWEPSQWGIATIKLETASGGGAGTGNLPHVTIRSTIWHNILHKSVSQTTLQKLNFHSPANICYALQNICVQTLPHGKKNPRHEVIR